MRHRLAFMSTIVGLGVLLVGVPLQAQLPGNDVVRPKGQGVAPVYEGWYEDPDGEGLILSFGYMNRNGEEIVDIPLGAANNLDLAEEAELPGELAGRQPTHFLPRRWWGVFAVEVPEDFGRNEVVWTIDVRGERYEIPGRVTNKNYLIDAMYAPASRLTPPELTFERSGETVRGPRGVWVEGAEATVGEPLDLEAWTRDDTWGNAVSGEGDGDAPDPHEVTLRWYKYQGPGEVSFDAHELVIEPRDGNGLARAATTATFAEPGEYVLYVRADNENMRSAGMEQCCWTNGYLQVTVSP